MSTPGSGTKALLSSTRPVSDGQPPPRFVWRKDTARSIDLYATYQAYYGATPSPRQAEYLEMLECVRKVTSRQIAAIAITNARFLNP